VDEDVAHLEIIVDDALAVGFGDLTAYFVEEHSYLVLCLHL
jgi:hypothetical protein